MVRDRRKCRVPGDGVPSMPARRRYPSANPVPVFTCQAGAAHPPSASVPAEALRRSTGPCGSILGQADPILAVGALVASELYGVV